MGVPPRHLLHKRFQIVGYALFNFPLLGRCVVVAKELSWAGLG